jgi:hypothetical protein
MIKRIKKLIKQAQEVYTYSDVDGDNNRGVRLNEEKFAELIVRECAKFLDNSGLYICNNAGSPTPKELLQHFGIEE